MRYNLESKPIIKIITKINSDPKTVFDLSRNIDFHIESAKGTSEKAIAGKPNKVPSIAAATVPE